MPDAKLSDKVGLTIPGVLEGLNPTAYNPELDAVERFVENNYHVVASTPSWELLQPNAKP